MSLLVYGIPNCNTVKKARTWLDEQGASFVFHDYKKQGVPAERLADWIKQVGWEVLVNRQGTHASAGQRHQTPCDRTRWQGAGRGL